MQLLFSDCFSLRKGGDHLSILVQYNQLFLSHCGSQHEQLLLAGHNHYQALAEALLVLVYPPSALFQGNLPASEGDSKYFK